MLEAPKTEKKAWGWPGIGCSSLKLGAQILETGGGDSIHCTISGLWNYWHHGVVAVPSSATGSQAGLTGVLIRALFGAICKHGIRKGAGSGSRE